MKLWASESVSLFGSQITVLALPLTAVLVLGASPFEMGLLGMLGFLPFLLLSLFAGVWVDRLPRRRILVTANLGRALLLALIPLAAYAGWLTMPLLYAVSVLVGVLTVFFDVAYQAYLPDLVAREQLVDGNSKLEASRSVAQIGGPALGGVLVERLTAPVAMALDAASFLVSALLLALIPGTQRIERPERQPIWSAIAEGLRVVLGSPILRAIAGSTGTSNFFANVWGAVFTLYAVQELGIGPSTLGLIFAVGSGGALVGAFVAAPLTRRLGVGPTIIVSMLVSSLSALAIPLARGGAAVALLMAGQAVLSLCGPIYNVTQVSLRQTITPARLQGRMNASMRFLVWGTIPLGSLAGGLIGESLGIYTALLVGTLGAQLAFLWVLLSPVRALREHPEPEEAPAPAQAPA
jgi:MFS family permease